MVVMASVWPVVMAAMASAMEVMVLDTEDWDQDWAELTAVTVWLVATASDMVDQIWDMVVDQVLFTDTKCEKLLPIQYVYTKLPLKQILFI